MRSPASGPITRLSFCFLILTLLLAACSPAASGDQTPSQPVMSQTPTPSFFSVASTATLTLTPTITETAPATTTPPPTETITPEGALPTDTPDAAQATGTLATVPETGEPSVTKFPDPKGYEWKQIAVGYTRPVDMRVPPDNTGRMFVVEKRGIIKIIKDGGNTPKPFLDITDRVGSASNEQGLLGLAFHPQYAQNGFFYVNYTDKQGNTNISRFRVSQSDADLADSASEEVLIHVQQPFPNHNGGSVYFGPDGYLYLGLGDGGSAGDPNGNGQSTKTLLGKILRLDVDKSGAEGGAPYAYPSDNPFVNSGDGMKEIYALGLRNPWRFSFDMATGDMFIADVGQNLWEEVDYLPKGSGAGANLGWNYFEASHPYKGKPPADTQFVQPVFEYPHDQGCSVTGGFVYRGKSLPDFSGIYLFADYCSGYIWGMLKGDNGAWQTKQLFKVDMNITSFAQDLNGEVYVLDEKNGGLFQLSAK